MEEKLITVDLPHDAGKTFRIRVFPALKAEKWAMRALVALFGSNAELPPDLAKTATTSSMAALASVGMRGLSGLNWETLEPLYDELLGQVAFVPDVSKPQAVVPLHADNVDAHIKNGATIALLRAEVFALCVNFSAGGAQLGSLQDFLRDRLDSSNTQTVPESSAP